MSAIAIQVTRYQCPHCRQSWSKRSVAARHVAKCWRDPALKSCGTCEHYSRPTKPDPFDQYDQGEPESCDEGIVLEWPEKPLNCPSWSAKP